MGSDLLLNNQRQFMKAIIAHATTNGWQVASTSTRHLRGYLGIKLQRTQREPPGKKYVRKSAKVQGTYSSASASNQGKSIEK